MFKLKINLFSFCLFFLPFIFCHSAFEAPTEKGHIELAYIANQIAKRDPIPNAKRFDLLP